MKFHFSLPVSEGETRCNDLTYRCKNNKCISKVNPECDGTPDCEDGSDEANCGTFQPSPGSIHPICRSIARLEARQSSPSALFRLHNKPDVVESKKKTAHSQQAPTGFFFLFCPPCQTAGGICSRRRVSWVARRQKRGSFPGRSASTSKVTATCVERPSSARTGWSPPPTVCKMTAGPGSVLVHSLSSSRLMML